MKRAKIMLTAIAVLAVIGGALAFKANTLSVGGRYFTCAPVGVHQALICTTNGATQYTDQVAGDPILFDNGTVTIDNLQSSACTDGAPCSLAEDFQSYTINE